MEKNAYKLANLANDSINEKEKPVLVTDGTVTRAVVRASVVEDCGKQYLELNCPENRHGNILLEMIGCDLTEYSGASYDGEYYIAPDWWHKLPPRAE